MSIGRVYAALAETTEPARRTESSTRVENSRQRDGV
jgi:hypothetical protein